MSKDIPGAGTKAVVEQAKEEHKNEVASAVAEALKEVLPAAMAAAASFVNQQQNAAAVARAPVNVWAGEKCNDCKQLLKACKGEHEQAVVYPTIEEFGEYFPGVILNGVRYLSNNSSHVILIPKNTEIKYLTAKWQENEASIRMGRKKSHNSGSIGPGGGRANYTNAIGFR